MSSCKVEEVLASTSNFKFVGLRRFNKIKRMVGASYLRRRCQGHAGTRGSGVPRAFHSPLHQEERALDRPLFLQRQRRGSA